MRCRALLTLLSAAVAGCGGGPQLTVAVTGGAGKVTASYFTPGTDCIFCRVPHWTQVIDCDELGQPACSGIMPADVTISMGVAPSPAFRLLRHDCPVKMPAMDVSCTVTLMSCSATCPSCAAAPTLDASNTAQTVCYGDTVTLTGANLGGAQACVTVNGVAMTQVTGDATSISFEIGSLSAMGDTTTIETSKGKVTTRLVTVTADPIFSTLTPSTGAAGSTFTITGLRLTGVTVKLAPWDETDGAPPLTATVVSGSDTELVATVPSGVQPGRKYVVTVENVCGPTGQGGQHPFVAK